MTISEVAIKYDLTSDTLRYYEKIGLIPTVGRTGGGIRDYNAVDIGWVEFIKCMRGAGLPIDVLIEYVKLFQQGDSTAEERKNILIRERDLLMERSRELQRTVERLTYKIDNYDNFSLIKE